MLKLDLILQIKCYQNKAEAYNLGQKAGGKFTKLSKIHFSMECLQLTFCNFLPKNVKIWLFVGRLGTTKPKHFRDFLEIY